MSGGDGRRTPNPTIPFISTAEGALDFPVEEATRGRAPVTTMAAISQRHDLARPREQSRQADRTGQLASRLEVASPERTATVTDQGSQVTDFLVPGDRPVSGAQRSRWTSIGQRSGGG